MICFKPNGSYCTKVNICSCQNCLLGEFLDCVNETGKYVTSGCHDEYDSESGDSDACDHVEIGDISEEGLEVYELRSNSVIDIVQNNTVIALYSHQTH